MSRMQPRMLAVGVASLGALAVAQFVVTGFASMVLALAALAIFALGLRYVVVHGDVGAAHDRLDAAPGSQLRMLLVGAASLVALVIAYFVATGFVAGVLVLVALFTFWFGLTHFVVPRR